METRTTISKDVAKLFAEQPIARDLALQLLNSWIANLQATEARISRDLLGIVGVFFGFLALDTGVLAKLAFQGAELQRTGVVLCAVPMTIAFLYYRAESQVSFAHDLRTAIARSYRELHAPVFYGGLDLLTHIPSVRNLEAYDSLRAPRRMDVFHERTTDLVTIAFFVGPVAAVVYTVYRLWHYSDVGLALWLVAASVSLLFVVRAWFFALKNESDDDFSNRTASSPSNRPRQPTSGAGVLGSSGNSVNAARD